MRVVLIIGILATGVLFTWAAVNIAVELIAIFSGLPMGR